MAKWQILNHSWFQQEPWAGPLLCLAGIVLLVMGKYFTGAGLLFVGAVSIFYYLDDRKPSQPNRTQSKVAPVSDEYDKFLQERGMIEEDGN